MKTSNTEQRVGTSSHQNLLSGKLLQQTNLRKAGIQDPGPGYLPAAAAAATSVLVGSSIVVTRAIIAQVAPGSLAFMRYLIALSFLLPGLLASRGHMVCRPMFTRLDIGSIALIGMVQFGIVTTLLNYGLQLIPSAQAALIFSTMPLLAMIFAVALGREAANWPKMLGVLFSIIGVGFALGEGVILQGFGVQLIGDMIVLTGALGGAACSVSYEPFLRKYRMLHVTAISIVSSLLFLVILATEEGFFNFFPHFTKLGWVAIFFIGASSGIGTYLWLWALGNATPTKVTVFLALSPLTAASLGILFLSEGVSFSLVLGIGLVALGLWLVHRS